MKKLYVLCFLMPFCLNAQKSDSLAVAQRLDSLIQEGRQMINNKQYEAALKHLEQAKDKINQAFGKEHVLMGDCLHNFGRTYQMLNKNQEALDYYLEAKVVRAKTVGETHLDYAGTLIGLGHIYRKTGKREEAEKCYTRAAEIRKTLLGEDHVDYINLMAELGDLYVETGDYERAKSFMIQTKALREKAQGKENMDYVSSVNTLATFYRRIAQYDLAEPLIYEALSIIEKIKGKEHVYAITLNNLANLYWEQGDYERAIEIHLESKSIRERVLGKEHPDYAQSLTNLANLYIKTGKYEQAEIMLVEAKTNREKYYGKEHVEYAKATMGLAYLHLETGNYQRAEVYFMETKKIREKNLGKENTDYASTLNGLALLYTETKRYELAESLYEEIRAVYEKRLGKNHPYYARNRNNMADLYIKKGNYKQAENLLLEAKSIREAKSGKNHPEYALCLSSLATVSLKTKDYENAENYAREALILQEKLIGKENPEYLYSLETLAKVYLITNRYELAEPLFVELLQLGQMLVVKGMNHLTEKELSNYVQNYRNFSHLLCNFAGRQPNSAVNALAWNNAMFSKGLLLDNTRALERAMEHVGDSVKKVHTEWKKTLRQLAVAYGKTDGNNTNTAALEVKANALEKTLIRSVTSFADLRKQYTWQDVQAKLQKEEAAVEFVHYTPLDQSGTLTDSILYAALVLLHDGKGPIWVPLCSQTQFDALMSSDKKYSTEVINRFYTSDNHLYELIWKPIEKALAAHAPVKTFYLAPSGILHRINFSAIATNPGAMLSDRYDLVLTGSTRHVVTPFGNPVNNKDAILFGGVRYDADTINLQAKLSTLAPIDESMAFRGSDPLMGNAWRYLPFTEREVSSIEQLLAKNKLKPLVRKNLAATEEVFKRIGQFSASPRVLHLATHGFFFPDPQSVRDTALTKRRLVFKDSRDPMMRTGLILAGANRVWQGQTPLMQQEDGVLTAYEISQMSLSNTELVVLSACETGLGDIQGSEGVYGLQRAFKMAGARYVILSLWQTPDKQTAQLMTSFYRNWLENRTDIPTAFRAAQKQMRDLGLEPHKWAGFVLIE